MDVPYLVHSTSYEVRSYLCTYVLCTRYVVHSTYMPCPKLHAYIRPYIVVLDNDRHALFRARPWRYAITIPERNAMQPHAADLRPDPETRAQEGVF